MLFDLQRRYELRHPMPQMNVDRNVPRNLNLNHACTPLSARRKCACFDTVMMQVATQVKHLAGM